MSPTRRAVVRAAAAAAVAVVFSPRGFAQPRFVDYPFRLGVASGYPTPTGVSLWTRLAPSPLSPDGGMPAEGVQVDWEVASDEAFGTVVASGRAGAYAENAHSVHVDVEGLAPGRWYFYRFHAGDEVSPVGRTRTAEAPGTALDRLTFAFGSCQHYEQGWYGAHRHLLAENLDLMVFLGDYMYESSWGDALVRRYAGNETVSLSDYRVRHAQHKADADLQRLHGAVPWAVVWDDHEVDNDWAADRSEHLDPQFLARRAAAFQAFYEHMPIPRRLWGASGRVYTELSFGTLARFYLLDDRSYRSPQACAPEGGSSVVPGSACPELRDPARTLLGATQEAWLDGALQASRQTWNIVAQQTLVTNGAEGTGPDRKIWTDGWEGYPAARRRFLDTLQKRRVANPIVVGGDIHAAVVADLRLDPDDPRTPIVAAELCGTSITSQGGSPEDSAQLQREHPDVRYANGWQRGYTVVRLDTKAATASLRVVDEKVRDSGVATASTWRVDAGRAGLVAG